MHQELSTGRKIVSIAVSAVVGVLLLAAIAWMLHEGLGPSRQRQAFDETQVTPPAPKSRVRTGVDLAVVPWQRDAAQPQPALVGLFTVPWSRSASNPQVAVTPGAFLPWTRDRSSPVLIRVPISSVPNLPRYRERAKPESVNVALADIPWGRGSTIPGAASETATARIPWTRPRAMPAHVYTAEVPSMHPKREWRKPQPAKVALAEAPWGAPSADRRIHEILLARVPVLRSAMAPDPAVISPAAVPWQRSIKTPLPARIEPANISSRLNRIPRPN